MKISVNWLKQFTDIDLSVDELVKKIGAQLGAVEEVTDLGKKYQGIVIAKVVSCDKHPDADRLHLCKIDDNGKTQDVLRDENGFIQVVCGAPNVREGLIVAWLPPGVTVPSTYDKEPFVLEAREIRGQVSNGMLASAAELAISDDHSGILELSEGNPGDSFAEIFKLNDHIIEIENKMFTHRPDCFGQLGVAREVAGIFQQAFKSPDWYLSFDEDSLAQEAEAQPLEFKNGVPELVPRFTALVMSGVKVAPSPFWLQTYLSRAGVRPINNVVDLTNYYMLLTAQPLHAYDADKLRSLGQDGVARLETRASRQGDKLKLLNGKEVTFQDDSTILITSNDVPVGVGGVMGGADTEVDENTTSIILECASFDMYSIRRTAMKYGLFTDAVTRFNKGQSPLQTDRVIAKTVQDLREHAGAKVAGALVDDKHDIAQPAPVQVSAGFVNDRLGFELSADEMARLLTNVEFSVEVHGENMVVQAPFWRTDIDIAEDVVEEIGRLYGYDHLPVELPARSIKPAKRDEMLELKSQVRDVLSRAGATEVLTYSFVHGNLLEKAGQDKEQAFELSNALSPELQYYRLSLTPSLLEKVHPNIKSGYDEFAIFEIGKFHNKAVMDDDGLPDEYDGVELVYASNRNKPGAAYHMALRYVDHLLSKLRIAYHIEPVDELFHQIWLPFDAKRSGYIRADNGGTLGVVGELRPDVRRSFKLPPRTAAFTLTLEPLGRFMLPAGQAYTPLSKYPSVSQDISLKVSPATLPYQAVYDELRTGLSELAGENMHTELTPLDIYQKGDTKHFTFRLIAVHYGKTLKSVEINQLLDNLAERAKQKFDAERI